MEGSDSLYGGPMDIIYINDSIYIENKDIYHIHL